MTLHEDKPLDITFFVPCYNEEKNVNGTIDTIQEAMKLFSFRYEILVCDDGSRDKTKDVVEKRIKDNPEIPLRLDSVAPNRGLGANYFRCASLARGKNYMLVAGDNVLSAEAMQKIVSQCGRYDMIIPHFRSQDDRTWLRLIVSRAFSFLVNLLSGNHLYYYNGPVLQITDNVKNFKCDASGYGYQAELICHLLQQGKTYKQVQVHNAEREQGKSSAFSRKNLVSVGKSLLKIFGRRIKHRFCL